jgi:hypothetical protein
MKKIIVLVLFSVSSFSQIKKETKIVNLEPSLRLGINSPIYFGNNFFAKDFSGGVGFSSNFTFIKVYQTNLSFGYEYNQFNLKNKAVIGNFEYMKKHCYFVEASQNITLNTKFTIVPFIQFAAANIKFKNEERKTIAKQNGNEIKIGSYLDYNFNTTYTAYFGINYIKYFNSLNANASDQKYFGNSNAIQLTLGFEFN